MWQIIANIVSVLVPAITESSQKAKEEDVKDIKVEELKAFFWNEMKQEIDIAAYSVGMSQAEHEALIKRLNKKWNELPWTWITNRNIK